MTFDERVQALDFLRVTPRQTRFLATVALHSGFCLRRQYATFAEVADGKNGQLFLKELVSRRLATRVRYESNRGFVYHLHARSIYRAIGQTDNRNRRVVSPALVARKLMLLDFILAADAGAWCATEAEKVALFGGRFGLPESHLPRRVYPSSTGGDARTTRYFLDKLPIGVVGAPPVVHFVYLAADIAVPPFGQFLSGHRSLFASVPEWAIVLVTPRAEGELQPLREAFDGFVRGATQPIDHAHADDLEWYFGTRAAIERNDLRDVSVTQVRRYRAARSRFRGAAFERLFAEWKAGRQCTVQAPSAAGSAVIATKGRLIVHHLRFSYTRFGPCPEWHEPCGTSGDC